MSPAKNGKGVVVRIQGSGFRGQDSGVRIQESEKTGNGGSGSWVCGDLGLGGDGVERVLQSSSLWAFFSVPPW